MAEPLSLTYDPWDTSNYTSSMVTPGGAIQYSNPNLQSSLVQYECGTFRVTSSFFADGYDFAVKRGGVVSYGRLATDEDNVSFSVDLGPNAMIGILESGEVIGIPHPFSGGKVVSYFPLEFVPLIDIESFFDGLLFYTATSIAILLGLGIAIILAFLINHYFRKNI